MQIIIPMSGAGERFRKAGYDRPKPLIEVDGKPIIAHVIAQFPGETDFIFICSNHHLGDPRFDLEGTLRNLCPTAKIIGIPPHKNGPVHAILEAADQIDPAKSTFVSYCDYGVEWDYAAFKAMVQQSNCDGAVVGYTGFHPHMLRNHSYGYVRMEGERVADIQEKKPFTTKPMNEIALSGGYYFRDAGAMLESFRELSRHDELSIAGEHYVSLAFKFYLARKADIRAFVVRRFMQWGTPEDLGDYLYYAAMFRAMHATSARQPGAIVMPMAGEGRRFVEAGYKEPKPLIEVDGIPMAARALKDLPVAPRRRAILRRDLTDVARLSAELPQKISGLEIVMLDGLTEGQAITTLAGLDGIPDDATVTIAACDNGMVYDAKNFESLFANSDVDVIVWGARGYPPAARNARAYGWIDAADGKIKKVSVKIPLADPAHDPIVIGCFTFRRAGDFRAAVAHMKERNARVNNEFYIDTAINDAIKLGLDCRLFGVDYYPGWGTPDELNTYNYWREHFQTH